FSACVKSADQFRMQSSFRTYLFTIARNELYTYLHRLRPNDRADFDVVSIGEIVTSLRTRLDRAEEIERLRGALRELPAEQQLLLELCHWHELDVAQLAEIFETTPGNVRVRLHRARKALRARMSSKQLADLGGDRLAASLREDGDDD